MSTHCIFDENHNELTCYTGKNCLDNFFNHLKFHVNRINKMLILILIQPYIKIILTNLFV